MDDVKVVIKIAPTAAGGLLALILTVASGETVTWKLSNLVPSKSLYGHVDAIGDFI